MEVLFDSAPQFESLLPLECVKASLTASLRERQVRVTEEELNRLSEETRRVYLRYRALLYLKVSDDFIFSDTDEVRLASTYADPLRDLSMIEYLRSAVLNETSLTSRGLTLLDITFANKLRVRCEQQGSVDLPYGLEIACDFPHRELSALYLRRRMS